MKLTPIIQFPGEDRWTARRVRRCLELAWNYTVILPAVIGPAPTIDHATLPPAPREPLFTEGPFR